MKEISVEEKAMRYDDRLKRAQKWYVCNTNEGFRSIFEDIFPEFKESRDENIRNGIKILIDRSVEDGSAIAPGFNIIKEEAIAWIEKKGEEKPQVYETEDGEVITYSESKGYEVVEPKFKVGDWIISHYNHVAYIKSIDKKNYYLSCNDGNSEKLSIDCIKGMGIPSAEDRKKALAWIEKKGKKQKLDGTFVNVDDVREDFMQQVYNILDSDPTNDRANLIIDAFDSLPTLDLEKQGENNMGISEATKQKLEDNLNKALEKETPESWNEFLDKRGEQKPAWSEEDETKIKSIIAFLKSPSLCAMNGNKGIIDENIKYLKSLKDRVGCEVNCTTTNEWSEEDKKMFDSIINVLEVTPSASFIPIKRETMIPWLKSLKERVKPKQKQELNEDTQQWIDAIIKDYEEWYKVNKDHSATIQIKINILKSLKERYTWKPSDEQMKAIQESIGIVGELTPRGECLKELEEQLKKLKG